MLAKHRPHIITVSFLITGNIVGAGILALPINTGIAGFPVAIVGLIITGLALLATAFILSSEAIENREETFNYPSLFHKYLGGFGKWIAIVANLIILYGLLTAYITGASAIVTRLLPIPFSEKWVTLIFFAFITWVSVCDMRIVRKYNVALMILLWASFVILVVMSGEHMEMERLSFTKWSLLPAAIPVIVAAYHFHNLIPHVCHSLEWNKKRVAWAMGLGMIISFIMYSVWLLTTLGALPMSGDSNSIMYAFHNGLPATIPIARVIGSKFFLFSSMLFALLAICTSYIANSAAIMGFMQDLTGNHFGKSSKALDLALSFGPPLVISLIYPGVFLKSLNIVGGVGIVLLFGVLPCVIGIKRTKKRALKGAIWALLFIFSAFFVIEIAQETDRLEVGSKIEYWRTHYLQGK